MQWKEKHILCVCELFHIRSSEKKTKQALMKQKTYSYVFLLLASSNVITANSDWFLLHWCAWLPCTMALAKRRKRKHISGTWEMFVIFPEQPVSMAYSVVPKHVNTEDLIAVCFECRPNAPNYFRLFKRPETRRWASWREDNVLTLDEYEKFPDFDNCLDRIPFCELFEIRSQCVRGNIIIHKCTELQANCDKSSLPACHAACVSHFDHCLSIFIIVPSAEGNATLFTTAAPFTSLTFDMYNKIMAKSSIICNRTLRSLLPRISLYFHCFDKILPFN